MTNVDVSGPAGPPGPSGPAGPASPAWLARLKDFAVPDAKKATVQLIDTLVPYFSTIILMYLTIRWGAPIWVTLALSLPAGCFMVRAFILFHDCCHGSFLKSRRAMDVIGSLLGVLTFTPYAEWRHSHGIHHSTVGNLDRRGVGDVWTMTVEEYRANPPFRRFLYRAYRHPVILFGFGPFFLFLLINRFPGKSAKKAQKRSVVLTDIAILAIAALWSLAIGIRAYLLIQMPTLFFAALVGIWLFYVQHQFDPTYWARSEDWQSLEASMTGSSFYKLPKFMQWISGNIGLHHIHHLMPRIPNYRLQACIDAIPELRLPNPLTFGRSLASVSLNLWDEAGRRLVSFRELHFRRSVPAHSR
ncbi:MAG TPA: fatty acid desaturase [Treponema sp.]|nr:fatty acid desaturase [Treponema sp.]